MVDLHLQNGPDAVRVIRDGEVIDLLGWGEHTYPEFYMGEPADDVSDQALVRVNTTGNNSMDFIAGDHTPRNSQGNSITVFLDVIQERLKIENITMEDDSPDEGIQIIPYPGQTRGVIISFDVLYDGDCEELSVIGGSLSGCTGTLELEVQSSMLPGTYDAAIEVADIHGNSNSSAVSYEVMPITSIEVDTQVLDFAQARRDAVLQISGDEDMATPELPTVRNTGNVPIDMGIMGSDFLGAADAIPIDSLGYTVGMHSGRIGKALQLIDVDLAPGQMTGIWFDLTVPNNASRGEYVANAVILAVPG
jgi:hypothetical protein